MTRYTQIPSQIFELDLDPATKGVLLSLISVYDIKRRKLWYTQAKIANICRISVRQLSRYMIGLETKGVITKLSKGCKFSGSTEWQIPLYKSFLDELNRPADTDTKSVDVAIRTKKETPAPQQEQEQEQEQKESGFIKPTERDLKLIEIWNERIAPEDVKLNVNARTIKDIRRICSKLDSVHRSALVGFLNNVIQKVRDGEISPRTPAYITDEMIDQWLTTWTPPQEQAG